MTRVGHAVKEDTQLGWRAKIEETATKGTEKDLWKTVKGAQQRGELHKCEAIPELSNPDGERADTIEGIADLLQGTFWPQPLEAELNDIQGYKYPEPFPDRTITEREITNTASYKAPGPDYIPNGVLKLAMGVPAFLEAIKALINACYRQGYCPVHFKELITVALPKPGKSDYTSIKAYRPIVLLNTLGKAMESVIATRLSYHGENGALPNQVIGGRKLRATEDVFLEQTFIIHSSLFL